MTSDDKILRAKIVRLARERPEFRKQLLPLIRKTASPVDPKAYEAVAALVKAAQLPAGIEFSPTKNEVEVAVPKGFSSLFKTIEVNVRWHPKGGSGGVEWRYSHPTGSNGYRIGWVVFNTNTNRWEWRLETGGGGSVD
jgi:hypothetical protein